MDNKKLDLRDLDQKLVEQHLLEAQSSIEGVLNQQLNILQRDVPLAEAIVQRMSTKQLRKTLLAVIKYPFFIENTGLNKKEEAAMQLVRSVFTSIVLLEMHSYTKDLQLLDRTVKDAIWASNNETETKGEKTNG